MADSSSTYSPDRLVRLHSDCAPIPERLLLAHAKGRVLFITGAGISMASGLPDFRGLVLRTYERVDSATFAVLAKIPWDASNKHEPKCASLNPQQCAEVRRFVMGDYDVVLGMLERRLDGIADRSTTVRRTIGEILRETKSGPSELHGSLIRLADRGGATTIVTTNFDLLLEVAGQRRRKKLESYALDSIPRPSRRVEFSGVFHIHGALDSKPERLTDFIVSDQDFGEFYLRRRAIPDFIYDAARLFNIVLVGYSANDPPMRYLLNAVAADGSRFDDLKERFTFVGSKGSPEPRLVEDWKGRGITPITYDSTGGHAELARTLARWAELSANSGKRELVDRAVGRITTKPRPVSSDDDRDLFDHFIRRSDTNERIRLAKLCAGRGADVGWLDAINSIIAEPA